MEQKKLKMFLDNFLLHFLLYSLSRISKLLIIFSVSHEETFDAQEDNSTFFGQL